MRSVGAPPSLDTQYTIHEYGIAASFNGNNSLAGKTLVSSPLVPGQKTLIFLVIGQSLAANHNGSILYTPANSLVHNLNVYDGNCYKLIDPVLGASPLTSPLYSWMGRLGDNVINAGICQRIIFVPVAIGGSSSFDWSTGTLFSRIQVAANRIRQQGWPLTAVLWQQGQADNTLSTSSAQYQTNVKEAQNILIGQGFNVPWLIAVDTLISGSTSATIAAAQAALVNNPANRFAGPNVDALTVGGGFRLPDQTHLSDIGLIAIAGTGSSGWQTAIANMNF